MIRYCLSIYLFLFYFYGCTDNAIVCMGIEGKPLGFDPLLFTGLYENHIYAQVYETLFTLREDYSSIQPNLVEEWSVSEDKCVYRFKLRPNIRFHNQKCLNSADVLFSITRYQENVDTWPLNDIISNLHIIDSLSFEIILKKPYALLLYALGSPDILLIQLSDKNSGNNQQGSAHTGTGPFMLERIRDDGSIILKSNPHYRHGPAQLDRIIFRSYNDHMEQAQAIKDGEVDIIYMVSSHIIDRLKWTGKVEYLVGKPLNIQYIGFNNRKDLFSDQRVRQAFLYALDVPKIVYNANRGNAEVATGPLPPVYNGISYPLQASYDPEAAKRLFNSAGIRKGMQFDFHFPGAGNTRQITAEMLQSQLSAQGIYLDLHLNQSWDTHQHLLRSGETQIFFYGYDSEIAGDPGNYLKTLFHSKSDQNYLNYNNPMVDLLLDLSEETFNFEKRNIIYQQIVSIIMQDTPAVFLNHVIPHFAYRSEKIKRLSLTPYQIIDFHKIELCP